MLRLHEMLDLVGATQGSNAEQAKLQLLPAGGNAEAKLDELLVGRTRRFVDTSSDGAQRLEQCSNLRWFKPPCPAHTVQRAAHEDQPEVGANVLRRGIWRGIRGQMHAQHGGLFFEKLAPAGFVPRAKRLPIGAKRGIERTLGLPQTSEQCDDLLLRQSNLHSQRSRQNCHHNRRTRTNLGFKPASLKGVNVGIVAVFHVGALHQLAHVPPN